MSTELMSKIEGILQKADTPDRHTFFQIEKFMIGKEPTAQSQLWAIVRELQARKETVECFNKDLKDAEDNLELFDIKIERLNRAIREQSITNSPDNDLNIMENEINIRKLQRDKQQLIESARKVNKKLKCVWEEIEFLVKSYDSIIKECGEMKPVDDLESQKEMWNEKLLEEFNLRVIFQRPFDPEFVRTVMCLHDDAPVKKHITQLVNNIQEGMRVQRITGKTTNG